LLCEAVLRAQILDDLLEEFAPPVGSGVRKGEHLIGGPDAGVGKFFVAWSPAQLEGIIKKRSDNEGVYVAYLCSLGDEARCLLSLGLRDLRDVTVRLVRPTWRFHSWGVASKIAKDLGLSDPHPVLVIGRESDLKVVTFVPRADVPKVRESLFAAGAGRYGLYSRCSFSASGIGTFFGEKGAKPSYGEAGRLQEMDEERLEVLVPFDRLGKALTALRKAHPYEQPVIEAYEVASEREFGEGRVGRFASAVDPAEASRRIASVLGSKPIHVSGDKKAQTVMIWDGEPEQGLYEALLRNVDLYVGPDSQGLAALSGGLLASGCVEFPLYCFLLMGAKELVYMVREKSKREAWGLRTFLPSKVGREGAST
jgi:hypothetical protein